MENLSPCGPVGSVAIPSVAEIQLAQFQGYTQALADCPGLAPWETIQRPAIRWMASPVWVANAHATPGGSGSTICAAGVTLADQDLLVISTAEPARTLPLVTWETRNYFWIKCGRPELAY